MWIVLAVVFFLAGQLYLFRCLRKLDHFVEEEEAKKDVLSVALAESVMEEQMSRLLEGYSVSHPNVELVIYMDPKVKDAVRQRKADVGLCKDAEGMNGFNSLMLTFPGGVQRQMIWTNSSKVGEFARYLLQASGND